MRKRRPSLSVSETKSSDQRWLILIGSSSVLAYQCPFRLDAGAHQRSPGTSIELLWFSAWPSRANIQLAPIPEAPPLRGRSAVLPHAESSGRLHR